VADACAAVVVRADVVGCPVLEGGEESILGAEWVVVDDAVVVDDGCVTEWVVEGCACDGPVVGQSMDVVVDENPLEAAPAPTVAESAPSPGAIPAAPAAESVIAPPPVGGADALENEPRIAEEPAPEQLPPTPDASTDDVQQATAVAVENEEAAPADGTAAVIETPVTEEAPVPAVEPVEPNLFEEADAAAAEAVGEGAADEPTPPVADPFDAALRPVEPVRRWIDRSGGYAVVGALVAVREDGTCVLAAAGRTLTVPLDALSDHDREYASRAEGRLAARGPRHVRDTAGL
jgi:hypothetical protein